MFQSSETDFSHEDRNTTVSERLSFVQNTVLEDEVHPENKQSWLTLIYSNKFTCTATCKEMLSVKQTYERLFSRKEHKVQKMQVQNTPQLCQCHTVQFYLTLKYLPVYVNCHVTISLLLHKLPQSPPRHILHLLPFPACRPQWSKDHGSTELPVITNYLRHLKTHTEVYLQQCKCAINWHQLKYYNSGNTNKWITLHSMYSFHYLAPLCLALLPSSKGLHKNFIKTHSNKQFTINIHLLQRQIKCRFWLKL